MTRDDELRGERRRLLRGATAACALCLVGVPARTQTRVISIVARKFEFVPAEIKVARGETVVLELSAPEVPMGFSLVDYKLRADIVPGKVASLRLTADKAGTFTFLCDVFCGSGHEDMSGTLVVG